MDNRLYHPLAHSPRPKNSTLASKSSSIDLPTVKTPQTPQRDEHSSLTTPRATRPSVPVGPMLSKATASGYSSSTNFSASSKLKEAGNKLYTNRSPASQSTPTFLSQTPTISTSHSTHQSSIGSNNSSKSSLIGLSSSAFTSSTIDSKANIDTRNNPSNQLLSPLQDLSSSPDSFLVPIPISNRSLSPPSNAKVPGSNSTLLSNDPTKISFASSETPSSQHYNTVNTTLYKRKLKSPRPRITRGESPQQTFKTHNGVSLNQQIQFQPISWQGSDSVHSLPPVMNYNNRYQNKSPISRVNNTTNEKITSMENFQKSFSSQSSTTERLIKQIFLPRESPQVNWKNKLPSLCSSDEVNTELYALIALVLRQFVLSWYYSIVDDPAFLSDIATVLANCTKLLEERLVEADLYTLFLEDIPMILEMHINDYRTVKQRYGSLILPKNSIEAAFHSLRPHPALDGPEDEKNYLKILAKGLVAFLLNEKDLNSSLAQTFVDAIVENLGLAGTIDKLSEPWMLYEIFTKIFETFFPDNFSQGKPNQEGIGNKKETSANSDTDDPLSNSETLKKTNTDGYESTAYDTTTETSNDKSQKSTAKITGKATQENTKFQYANVLSTSTQLSHQAGSIYQKVINQCASLVAQGGKFAAFVLSFSGGEETLNEKSQVPFVATSLFSCLSLIFQTSERRPLVASTLRIITSPLAFGRLRKVCNRIICYFINSSIRNEHMIANIVRTSRTTLFGPDNGMLGPPRPYPSEKEQEEARYNAMMAIYTCTPDNLYGLLFGDDPKKGIYDILDLFDNKVVNKHLIYNLLDHLITTLVPELVDMTPQELVNVKLGRMRQMI